MRNYVCIDIGGTAIKHGVIREDGLFAERGEMPAEAMEKGGPGIMDKAKRIISRYREKYRLDGICISTAGMVDCEKGEIFYSAPLIPNYTGTKIREILEETFHLPCEVENDVNCAGLAESVSGAGKGCSICLCLTVGTGIGGCIVMDGKVYHGFSNSACEVGYMKLDGEDFQDLGASKILVKKVEERKGLKPGSMNGKMIFERAKAGDEDCIWAVDKMADVLGKGIANICYVLNPQIVILGGGVMAQREYLSGRIRSAMDRYLLPNIAGKTALAFAGHQNDAGMLGAFYHFQNRRRK